jgi:hypothetical protein
MHRMLRSIIAASCWCAVLASGGSWAAGIDPGVIDKAKKEGELT